MTVLWVYFWINYNYMYTILNRFNIFIWCFVMFSWFLKAYLNIYNKDKFVLY
jgi:hypothetical protein